MHLKLVDPGEILSPHPHFSPLRTIGIQKFAFAQPSFKRGSSLGDDCLYYCLVWIAQELKTGRGTSLTPEIRAKYPASGEIFLRIQAAALKNSAQAAAGTGQDDQMDWIEATCGLRKAIGWQAFSSADQNLRATFGGLLAAAFRKLPTGSAMLIGVDVLGPEATGHAVAAFKIGFQTVYFFDPNCGAYIVHNQSMEQFMRVWEEAYRIIFKTHTLNFYAGVARSGDFYRCYS